MTSKELFQKYGQEIKDLEFRLEAFSYNKGWVFLVIIYAEAEDTRKKIEVNKKTFKKLAKILRR